jgi:hypothetical protein
MIAAIIILYIFFTEFAQYYLWPNDPIKKIASAIEAAQNFRGKAIEATNTVFTNGTGITRTGFANNRLEIKFECNSASNCCDKGTSCGNIVEWSDNYANFKQTKKIQSFARCNVEHNIGFCTVYIGQKPAQVEIVTVQSLKQIDLSKEATYKMDVLARNTGELIAPSVFAKAKLFKTGMEEEAPLQEKITQGVQLRPGEEKLIELDFLVEANAAYTVQLRVEGDNAGFDENKIGFTATGKIVVPCKATTKGTTVLDSITGNCETSYYCQGCTLAIECKEAWQKTIPNTAFTEQDAVHTTATELPINGKCS